MLLNPFYGGPTSASRLVIQPPVSSDSWMSRPLIVASTLREAIEREFEQPLVMDFVEYAITTNRVNRSLPLLRVTVEHRDCVTSTSIGSHLTTPRTPFGVADALTHLLKEISWMEK